MKATDLTGSIWNSIADLVSRSQSQREVYFVVVSKVDEKKKLIWSDDFMDIAIPLVSHDFCFAYYDTVPDTVHLDSVPATGTVLKHKEKREDKLHKNPIYQVEILPPKKGDLVVVLDPWGQKRFPICIGTIQSKQPFWEED